jgi:hypothetical protein
MYLNFRITFSSKINFRISIKYNFLVLISLSKAKEINVENYFEIVNVCIVRELCTKLEFFSLTEKYYLSLFESSHFDP